MPDQAAEHAQALVDSGATATPRQYREKLQYRQPEAATNKNGGDES